MKIAVLTSGFRGAQLVDTFEEAVATTVPGEGGKPEDADPYLPALQAALTALRARGLLGEAVGINFVAARDKDVLVRHLEECAETDYFERGIETAIAEEGLVFRPVDISDLDAVEVDFEGDLERANQLLDGR